MFEELGSLFLPVLPLPKLSMQKQRQTQHGSAQSAITRLRQPELLQLLFLSRLPIGEDDPPPTRLGQLFLLTCITCQVVVPQVCDTGPSTDLLGYPYGRRT